MSLDTTGMLLEGMRVATGNNQFTFPPRNLIFNQSTLDSSQSLGRAEYMLFVAGQATGASGIEIADPNISFFWSRNDSVTRFDYDMFARRWNTLPGGPPLNIGIFGNTPVVAAPIPDQTVPATEAPYYIYLGIPRQTVFTIQIVESDADFVSTLPAGTVQLSLQTGDLNWGAADLANVSYQNQPVYVSQQSFNSRAQSKGIFGQLPQSASESYLLYLNPIPGVGQIPRIRIGYQPYLTAVAYATEALLTTPPAGSVAWSQDTGRVLFAPADITTNLQSNVYYDGVVLGQLKFTRIFIADILGLSTFFPASIGTNPIFANPDIDGTRYVFFAEPISGPRYYFNVILGTTANGGTLTGPSQGQVLLDTFTGNIYISEADAKTLNGAPFYFLDSVLPVERGVGFQPARSGVNSGGAEQTPDFTEKYAVEQQVVQSVIMGSPFAQLPTVPLVDSNLEFGVLPNTSGGTYVGPLVNNATSPLDSIGYILNLDQKQIQYSARKQVSQTLIVPAPSIKLADSAIFPQGFEVTRNSQALVTGVDFSFDPNGGVLNFLTPIGEDDPANILNISGNVVLPNFFVSDTTTFTSANVGMFLLVSQGPNANLYQINGVSNANTLTVAPTFVRAGATQADVRANREIIADRFFTNFTPPLRTFTISSSNSVNGTFTPLSQTEFSAFLLTGQINLTTPTQPGEVFKITYVWQQSPDNGVTVTPTTITNELAAFKIRQETATIIPNTNTLTFNPTGRTVQSGKGFNLVIDGVTADPSTYNFVPPGTINVVSNFSATDTATIDYYVAESPGGNTSFFLANSPISIDYPQILSGATSATFNGDQTAVIQQGGAFLLNTTDVVLMGPVAYDATSDTTTVQLTGPSNYTNYPLGGTPTLMQICAPITGQNAMTYMVTETNPVDMLPANTNVISINAQVNYPQNTIVLINGDPYLVTSSTYDSTSNVTSVTLSDPALSNYITINLQHTIRPVLQAGTDFQTSQSATLTFPFTLVNSGTNPAVLRQEVDYTVSDGGNVKLTSPVGYGEVLNALYVARAPQAAGTTFTYNYAYSIAPSTSNGLLNQQLTASYDLYSPDTFFYNIETIVTYLPIVIATIQQNSSAGVGPNIQSQTTPQTKDQGTPSLYWQEIHYGNEDIVVQRLLYFYNTLVNNYEDILSNLDGRVVGGINGKFRYNGLSEQVPQPSNNPLPYAQPNAAPGLQWFSYYYQITNDIDDYVVLYLDVFQDPTKPFFTELDVPILGYMYQPNNLSRIYPTYDPFVTVYLNGQNFPVLNYGNTIGSTGISNLTSVSTLSTTRAFAPVLTAVGTGTTNPSPLLPPTTATTAVISINGDSSNDIPSFSTGQTVQFYNADGSPNGGTGTVSAIAANNDGTFTLGVSGVAITMLGGGVVRVLDSSSHYYTPNRDFNINNDDGIFTSNYLGLPSPPFPSVVHINGNELVDTSVTFVNSDTTPRRIPVLDGSTLSDNGRPAFPPLTRIGEDTYLGMELGSLPAIGNGSVSGSVITQTIGMPFPLPTVGQSGSSAGVAGLSGTGATITAYDATSGLLTIGGLSNMSPSLVGGSILLTGAANAGNLGIFIISAFISSTSVQVTDVTGSFPDANSGSINWKLTGSGSALSISSSSSQLLTLTGLNWVTADLVGSSISLTGCASSGNNGSFIITAYLSPSPISGQSGTAATITLPAVDGLLTVGGLTGLTSASVGRNLIISNATSGANNGTFRIVSQTGTAAKIANASGVADANTGHISWTEASDSIQITNSSGTSPDGNNGKIDWAVEPGGVILNGLSGMNSTLIGTPITVSGAYSAGNNGTFIIASYISASSVVIINPDSVIPDKSSSPPPLTWSIPGTSTVIFINGPNAGTSFTATAVTPTTITISGSPIPAGPQDYYTLQPTGDLIQAINGELFVLNNTVEAPISPPALIGSIDSELKSIDTAIQSYGQFQTTGSHAIATSATVLTDLTANFSTAEPPVNSSSLLYVTSGLNQGLYQIASFTDTTITISPAAPYPLVFPSLTANSPYIVMQPWSFLSSQEFAFASGFQQATLSFYAATVAWASAVTASGAASRIPVVKARQVAVTGFISTIQGLLGSVDNLYDTRYLWIQQRTDKTIGLLIQQAQAAAQRVTNTQNLVSAQQKLLVMNSLLKALS